MKKHKKMKYERALFGFLNDLEKIDDQLVSETDNKKIEKINKKRIRAIGHLEYTIQSIGKEGWSVEEVLDILDERQKNLVLESIPYGLKVNMTKKDKDRIFEIELCKDWIRDIKNAEVEELPYNPNLPVREKRKYKLYKKEVRLGKRLYDSSQPKFGRGVYDPEFNYLEHMRYAKEFTDEEKAIMERCYLIGEEYDRSTDTIHGKMHLAQVKYWLEGDLKNVCPVIVKTSNPGKNFTKEELRYESKEQFKRLLEFMTDEKIHAPYVKRWNEIEQECCLSGEDEEYKKNYIVDIMTEEVGVEKTFLTFMLLDCNEKVMDSLYRTKEYSYEELGLE